VLRCLCSDFGLSKEASRQLPGKGKSKEEANQKNGGDGSENDWILDWASDRSTANNLAHGKIAEILATHDKGRARTISATLKSPVESTKAGLPAVDLCDDVAMGEGENENEATGKVKQAGTHDGGPENARSLAADANAHVVAPVQGLNPYESIQDMVANEKKQGVIARDTLRMSLMKIQMVTLTKTKPLHYNPLSTVGHPSSPASRIKSYDVFGSKISDDSAARTLLYQSRQLPKAIEAKAVVEKEMAVSQSQPSLKPSKEDALLRMKQVFKFDEAEKKKQAREKHVRVRKEESIKRAQESKAMKQQAESLKPPVGKSGRSRRQLAKTKPKLKSEKHDPSKMSGIGDLPAPLEDGNGGLNVHDDLFYDDEDDDVEGDEDGGLDLNEWMNKWAIE